MANRRKRPSPISASNIEIPASVKFLSARVIKELHIGGAITHVQGLTLYQVDLEKLRIVILKGMAIAHRIGHGDGQSSQQTRATR